MYKAIRNLHENLTDLKAQSEDTPLDAELRVVLDFEALCAKPEEEVMDYGTEEVEALAQTLTPDLDKHVAVSGWCQMKTCLRKCAGGSFKAAWTTSLQDLSEVAVEAAELFGMIWLCGRRSSCCVERLFSLARQQYNSQRQCLTPSALENEVILQEYGRSYLDNEGDAWRFLLRSARVWNQVKRRRKAGGGRKKKPKIDAEVLRHVVQAAESLTATLKNLNGDGTDVVDDRDDDDELDEEEEEEAEECEEDEEEDDEEDQ